MTLGRIVITGPRCLLRKTFYNLRTVSLSLSLPLSALTWVVGEFFSGRVEWAGGEIKRSETSFHWQTVSVKDRGLMIGAARNIIYPESEDVWLQSSSPSSSAGTSSLYKCTIKMRCSHNTASPSDAWPMSYQHPICSSPYQAVIWRTNNSIIQDVGTIGNRVHVKTDFKKKHKRKKL